MAHAIDLERAEKILRYQFKQRSLLAQALQAPEKLQDKDTKAVVHEDDGNRALAQLGQSVLETILIDEGLDVGYVRGDVNNLKSRMARNDFLAEIARYSGLENCVKRSERQMTLLLPPRTLKTVTAATIGAVWRDSDRNFYETQAVISNLRISSMVDEVGNLTTTQLNNYSDDHTERVLDHD